MTVKAFIRKYLSSVLLTLSALCVIVSVFTPSVTYDIHRVANSVSGKLQSGMAQLDTYVATLVKQPAENGYWPELEGFPDDMVIYRYAADTLHSWYNLFNVMPALEELDEQARYRSYGRHTYVVHKITAGQEQFVAAIIVKNENSVNVTKGQGGINRRLHLHGRYSITAEKSGNTVPVVLKGNTLFYIEPADGADQYNTITSMILRWTALLLLIMSLVAYLYFHRSVSNCAGALALLTVLSFVARSWGMKMAGTSHLFSPILYAQNVLLNSFGVLLVFNSLLTLDIFVVYLCRKELAEKFTARRKPAIAYISTLAVFLLLFCFYLFGTLASIVVNSSISMQLHRFMSLSGYSFLAYGSYALLAVALVLLLEILLVAVNRIRGSRHTMMSLTPMLVASLLISSSMLLTVGVLGAKKEENRMLLWSTRLAADRDLRIERVIRDAESRIANDQTLDVLCHTPNSELFIQRIVEECFEKVMNQCSVSVQVVTSFDQSFLSYMDNLVKEGVSVSPDSHFIYSHDSKKGSYYTGVFSYYSERSGPANLIIEIVPNLSYDARIFPTYSYAKYENGRLNSFSGNYAYPTVLKGLVDSVPKNAEIFLSDGYKHFLNVISDEEVVVISRREESALIYFITLSYLAFLLMLLLSFFRPRQAKSIVPVSRLGARTLAMVVVSLTITLVVMGTVSVYFVYQRNEQNMQDTMSNKISIIQLQLDDATRSFDNSEALLTQDFRLALNDVSRNTSSPLDIYSPGGKLLISTSYNSSRNREMRSLISPEAFRNICMGHQRYFIEKRRDDIRNSYMLYAPIMNAAGDVLGIAASTYLQRDYNFKRDAVYHAATVVSLFLMLVFISVLVASAIVKAIVKPMVDIGNKMKEVDAENLETIEYKGNDEISSLVSAYNTMVHDLRESTGKLAAAERDKAWSEMARQVAHEIKNPLTPIKLEIQRLQRLKQRNPQAFEEKFDAISEVILEHIDILTQTANEFSTFAKLYSEPHTVIELDKTLKEQVMLFENRGVSLTYLGVEDVKIMGPKPQLIRVFINLLTNAVQAVELEENPKILVSLRKSSRAGFWDIVFEDNGPGVSEENRHKLFTPNFTTKSSGTGLGLAICRSIVDKCGGKISYSRSFTLGGACFTVSVPES